MKCSPTTTSAQTKALLKLTAFFCVPLLFVGMLWMTGATANEDMEVQTLTAEELEIFTVTYMEKFEETWEKVEPDMFRDLYTADGTFFRTFVRRGVEVRRREYDGAEALINGVRRTGNLRRDEIIVEVSDVLSCPLPGEAYLLFRQRFTSQRPGGGRVTYQDEVIKLLRLVQEPDSWRVDLEDSYAFTPEEYEEKYAAAFERFKGLCGAAEIAEIEPELPEDAIVVIPTPTPQPVQLLRPFDFQVVHEVTYEPLADVRVDVVDLTGTTTFIAVTDEEGIATVSIPADSPFGVMDATVFFNKKGFNEREIFYHEVDEGSEDAEVVLLPLTRPLTVPQLLPAKDWTTLRDLADRYYGSPEFWREILQANNDQILSDADITEDTMLILPSISQISEMRQTPYTVQYAGGAASTVESVSTTFFGVGRRDLAAGSQSSVMQVEDTSAMAEKLDGRKLYEVTVGVQR